MSSELFLWAAQTLRLVIKIEPLLTLLLVSAVVVALSGRARLGLGLGGLWAGLVALLCATQVPQMMLHALETAVPRGAEPAHLDGIILLGGTEDLARSNAYGLPLYSGGISRMEQAAALWHRHPNAVLLFTGGDSEVIGRPWGEVEIAQVSLLARAVAPGKLLLERQSRNTADNATLSHALVQPQPGQRWALVTSAYHMRRALATFEAAGWTGIVPWPTDYRADLDHPFVTEWNLYRNRGSVDLVLKEVIGALAYRVTGR